MRNSLWMRLQFYSRFLGLKYVTLIKHQSCPFVKNFFSQEADINIPGQQP